MRAADVFGRDRIEYKSDDQIRAMRRAGLVVAHVHDAVRAAVAPGLTTADLDAVAAATLAEHGATSNFLGYHGFTGVLCTSVNDQVVHGIPGAQVLAPGDVLSIDAGAIVAGWHGDAAFTMTVPAPDGAPVADEADLALIDATEAAMWAGIAALASARHLGEVSAAIDDAVLARGDYGIPPDYTGHGIGTAMHMEPEVLNYRTSTRGPRLRPGLVVCIEPMLTRGTDETRVLADDWTVVTSDGSRAAHWEHTVARHAGGIWVLTAHDGGRAGLAAHGITPAPLN